MSAPAQWSTLGRYSTRMGKGGTLTPHQVFLGTFTYGAWAQYSEISHDRYDGLRRIAAFFIKDVGNVQFRTDIDSVYPLAMTIHIMRACTILLCLLSEIQVHFRFDDAQIDQILVHIWQSMSGSYETKELYDERYRKLMEDAGIPIPIIIGEAKLGSPDVS